MASEEELSSASSLINVLTSQPPGDRVKPPRRAADPTTSSTDPLARTIVIHPGSRWLRIGRASEPAPIAVPNVIARKSRQPASSAQRRDTTDHSQAPTQTPTQTQTSVRPVSPPRPSATTATPVRQGDDDVVDEANEVGSDEDDEEQNGGGGSTEEARGQRATDPLAAKIMSIKADLRARMRAYKLRGQGNGNSQAATYNSTVVPESMGEEFEGDHEWTTGEAEVWVGNKVCSTSLGVFQKGAVRSLTRVLHSLFLDCCVRTKKPEKKNALSLGRADTRPGRFWIRRPIPVPPRRVQHGRVRLATRVPRRPRNLVRDRPRGRVGHRTRRLEGE